MNGKEPPDYRGKRVTVMGLGKFGGNIGAARWLAEQGARVTVTDLKPAGAFEEALGQLRDCDLTCRFGGHDRADFTETDLVVASPAVDRESPYLKAARAAGVTLATEIGLFVTNCPSRICGITGSNGKTTTVSMTGAILSASGRTSWIGGNIGGSLLASLDRMIPDDIVVLEISSFQLEWLDELKWSPLVAAILNLSPNHLDRHRTFEKYRTAKGALLAHQSPGDTAILVKDPPGSAMYRDSVRSRLLWVGTENEDDGVTLDGGWIARRSGGTLTRIVESRLIGVPGKHNVLNAMSASACALALGIDHTSIVSGLSSFKGVPHRLQLVGERDGVRFYNDSKATTPESTVMAVTSFDGRVIPILGGYDKEVSFDRMAEQIGDKVNWAALIGTTAKKIEAALTRAGVASQILPSLEDAFRACVRRAQPGNVVLLSPGCASYDMFSDFEERGERFIELVEEHIRHSS